MSLFAISDPHLSLTTDKPMDLFGGNWENHKERLEENWRSLITANDTVLLGGDLSWGLTMEEAKPDLDFLDALPGKKLVVKGNHDLWWTGIKRLNSTFKTMHFIQNDAISAEGRIICGSRGWICPGDSEWTQHDQKIFDREYLRMEMSLKAGEKLRQERMAENPEQEYSILVLMHFPPFTDKSGETAFIDLFHAYGVTDVYYGHVHGEEACSKAVRGERNGIHYYLTSCDYLNCMPKRVL